MIAKHLFMTVCRKEERKKYKDYALLSYVSDTESTIDSDIFTFL